MKIKFEPNMFEVGKEYHGKVVEVSEPVTDLLLQAHSEPEVFVVLNNMKHWIQNPETAIALNYDIYKREMVTLREINEYSTGDTILWDAEKEESVVGKRARDIYYPEESVPISQLEEMRDKRVILTLNPLPSKAQMIDLGFNGQMPYAGSVDGWTGDYISMWKNMPGPVILMFTSDYPDCRQHDPQQELAKLKQMKAENPNTKVGFCLNRDIGCGIGNKDEWLRVIQEADFVTSGVYPYHERYPDAMAELAFVADRIEREIDGVPFIPILQAIWGYVSSDGKKYIKPDVGKQVRFWVDRGYHGYIVYTWKDNWNGVADAQDEWKKWNEWARNNI